MALAVIRWLFESGRADEDFLGRARHRRRRAARARRALDARARGRARRASPPRTSRRFASLYAESSPAVIRCGWGLERNRNGGSAVAAVLALPAVAGKFGVRGGGYTMSNAAPGALEADAAAARPSATTRAVNMNQLGARCASWTRPPIRVLFVYNATR